MGKATRACGAALLGLLGTLALNACHEAAPGSSDAAQNSWIDVIVPMEIDGTMLYVPSIWNFGTSSKPRPWRNGVMVETGGWGQFEPTLGALQAVGSWGWPRDGIFRASSVGQSVDGRVDPFFEMSIRFEFPMPSPEPSTRWPKSTGGPFNTDIVDLKYRAPGERPLTYMPLLKGLQPNDGDDVGEGWREVTRINRNKPVTIRFDALDWRKQGGPLPRHLAASDPSEHSLAWTHHLALSPQGWSMDFDSRNLPLSRWRRRYATADALYDWLRAKPTARNAAERFTWWEDIRDRPTH